MGSMTALKRAICKLRFVYPLFIYILQVENIKDEITFRKHSKSPVNMLQRLKHGIHVLFAYFITREVNQKKKKFFGANLNINGWERYVNYKAVQRLRAQTVV